MKGIVCNCKTGEVKEVDDGLPFPQISSKEPPAEIDFFDVKKLIEYAKNNGWIK